MFRTAVIVSIWLSLIIGISCARTPGENGTPEPGGTTEDAELAANATPGRFEDFAASPGIGEPEFEIAVDAAVHPRLISESNSLRQFTKPEMSGEYAALMKIARQIWESPDANKYRTTEPGILAAAAFASANREYLSLAVKEIDRSLAPGKGFTEQSSLERVTWAAIGWDIIGEMMSVPDSKTIANTARLALDEDLLPYIAESLGEGDREITADDVLLGDGAFVRAYSAAFLWELALADDEESMKEILDAAYPVLTVLQDGLGAHLDEVDLFFIDGPMDDGLYPALLAWEKASGADILDKQILKRTIGKAVEFLNSQPAQVSQWGDDAGSIAEAYRHLLKWSDTVDEKGKEIMTPLMKYISYSPEDYLYIFLRPQLR